MSRRGGHVAEPASPGFRPMRIDDVELSEPLPELQAGLTEDEKPFAASLCLARLHGRPLGIAEIDLPAGGLPPGRLAEALNAELGEPIAEHLRADGLPVADLTADGISSPERPACVLEREQLLSDPPFVSVVVVTRDRPDRALATVRSILKSNYPADRFEVIVVETPVEEPPVAGRIDEARGDQNTTVRVVHQPKRGISLARNTGLEAAEGEIVVFADDDSDVDLDWLAILIAGFARGDNVGATSGITLPGSVETPSQRWFEGFGGLERGFETRIYDLANPPADQPLFPFTPGALGSGRSMAFRRDAFREIGGFDLTLGPPTPTRAGEDIDGLLRMLLAGHQVVHDPSAVVWHAHLPDYGMLRTRMWGYGVGVSACLTKTVLENPRLLPAFLRRLPGGVRFALSPSSEKNRRRQSDFPRELVGLERRGLAYGPLAYARSRWQQRAARAGTAS